MTRTYLFSLLIFCLSINIAAQEKRESAIGKNGIIVPSLEIPQISKSVKSETLIAKDIDWSLVNKFDASSLRTNDLKTILTDKVMGIYSLDDLPAIQRSIVVRPSLFVIDRCKN